MPTITPYEGKTDPQEHVDNFNDQMDLLLVPEPARCRAFAVTLTKIAKKWFRKLEPDSITSWLQLSMAFVRQFQGARSISAPPSQLASVRQRADESVKSYLNRFNSELAQMTNVPDSGALFVAMAGLKPETDFWKEVQRYGCRTLVEFYRRAEKYIRKDNS